VLNQTGGSVWKDRIFTIVSTSSASVSVVLENLAIRGGHAVNGGVLGGTAALGGGLLIDGGIVTLNDVSVAGN